jgi:hypothetical protein
MERGDEEATQESARGSAGPAGWPGAQRSQTAGEPRKWPQGRAGQKPQEAYRRPPQRTASASWTRQEVIQKVIALVRARFGDRAIGLGDRGIRFDGGRREDLRHAHPA